MKHLDVCHINISYGHNTKIHWQTMWFITYYKIWHFMAHNNLCSIEFTQRLIGVYVNMKKPIVPRSQLYLSSYKWSVLKVIWSSELPCIGRAWHVSTCTAFDCTQSHLPVISEHLWYPNTSVRCQAITRTKADVLPIIRNKPDSHLNQTKLFFQGNAFKIITRKMPTNLVWLECICDCCK